MNKKFIRVLGLGVGLFLAGSLSVNAQKVSFKWGTSFFKASVLRKLNLFRSIKIAYNTSQLDVNKQVVLNQKKSGCIANSVGFAKRNQLCLSSE